VTNALSQATSYEYDLVGCLKKVIYPDTNYVRFTYDLAGRRTKIKDPRGNETNFAYDAVHRLTSETNADNKVTSYTYDLMSNLTGVTDALNRTTNYSYDDFKRLKTITYPEAAPGAGRTLLTTWANSACPFNVPQFCSAGLGQLEDHGQNAGARNTATRLGGS